MSEIIFRNGPVITVNPAAPRARALLVRDARIVAVGDERAVVAQARPDAQTIDLRGRALLPGFNDAHIHLANLGIRETQVDLGGLAKAQIIERLKEAEAGLSTGAPLVGFGWDYPSCPDPHRTDLDKAFPERPVVLIQFSGHGGWVNGAMLSLLRLGPDSPGWPMGGAEKDGQGRLTGILREPFNNPRLQRLWFDRVRDRATARAGLEIACRRLAEHGVTSVQDNTWFPVTLSELRRLHAAGELTVRVQAWSLGKVPLLDLAFAFQRFDPDWYAKGPRKFFWDGAFSSRTALLTEPYADQPSTTGHGMSVDEIAAKLRRAYRWRRQVAAHSIGDGATARYVEAAATLPDRERVRSLRLRIEHGQLIRPEDVARIVELGMVVSAQPHAAADPQKDRRLLGPERAAAAYPYRTLLDAGVPLAFGSDYPGEATYDPLFGIHLAVNRDSPEAITVDEAIAAYTAGSAYAEWKEDEKGRLAPGFVADLVVLSDDPTAVAASRLRDIRVERTIVGGRTVFERVGVTRAEPLEHRLPAGR